MTITALPTVAATGLPAGTWRIDPAHSTVEFSVAHLGISTVKGRAPDVSGSITGGELASIVGLVGAESITTHDATRDEHLRSPEFFDADRHPELRFTSNSIERKGDALTVTGELTIKGVTRPAVLHGTFTGQAFDPWGNERLGLELEGEIDRTAYHLRWNAPLPGGGFLLGDTVRLSASFSAVKE
jgi:polyisoprenoid-binding protein YceI